MNIRHDIYSNVNMKSLFFGIVYIKLAISQDLVDIDGTMSNQIFEELADWEAQCKGLEIESIIDMGGPEL